MNIQLFTLCYNQSKIIPFVVDYWKNIGISHVYVYDNYSTDNSVQLLKSYGDWITVIEYNSNKTVNDNIYLMIKNNCWKNSKSDYVIVCDFDQVLWCNNIKDVIQDFHKRNITIVKPLGVQLYSLTFPEYIPGKLLHEYDNIKYLADHTGFCKCIMFNPKQIQEINYLHGCHTCNPVGTINFSMFQMKLIHIKHLSLQYILEKYKSSGQRLSQINKLYGWGSFYLKNKETLTKEFNENYNNAISDIKDII